MCSASPDSLLAQVGSVARVVDVRTWLNSARAKALLSQMRADFVGKAVVDDAEIEIKPGLETPQKAVRAEQPALMMTNERFSASKLKEWGEQHHPDGYIIAVGCGASLFLPHLFSVENPPRGVALIDLDDRVVAMSQAFVNALRRSQTYEEFYDRFFKDPVQAAPDFLPSEQASIFESLPRDEKLSLQSGINSAQLKSDLELNG